MAFLSLWVGDPTTSFGMEWSNSSQVALNLLSRRASFTV